MSTINVFRSVTVHKIIPITCMSLLKIMHRRMMKPQLMFIVAILFTDAAISYEIKTVKYNVSSSGDVICAASTTDDKYVGVRIHETSSSCEGLDINWRKGGAEHLPGYKYLLKQTTAVKFNPPVFLNEKSLFSLRLLIPGLLTPGSKMKLFFTKQSPWDRIWIRLTVKEQPKIEAGHIDTILYHVTVRSRDIIFNYYNNGWGIGTAIQRQFTEGVKRNLTILVTQESFQTFIDEELMNIFPHVLDPRAARLLSIGCKEITNVTIHSHEIDLDISD